MIRVFVCLVIINILMYNCAITKKFNSIKTKDINIARGNIKDDVIAYIKNDYIRSGFECDLEFLGVDMVNADTCIVRLYETNCKVTKKLETQHTNFAKKEEILMTIDLKNNKIIYAERIPAL